MSLYKMHKIENSFLKIEVSEMGAELKSLIDKRVDFECIWQGDNRFWAKSSPILFPIIGQLKENCYHYDKQSYYLNRHGFARDLLFGLVEKSDNSLTFELKSNDATKKIYPFDFTLAVTYELYENECMVTYCVINDSNIDLLFSVGGHPAFNLPEYSQCLNENYIEFPLDHSLNRFYLNGGLLSIESDQIELDAKRLFLDNKMFDQDAWVLKEVQSKEIYLKERSSGNGILFSFEGFPYLGLWSAPEALFICLEPWAGLPDDEKHNQDFHEKEGIIKLSSLSNWSAKWSVRTINQNFLNSTI